LSISSWKFWRYRSIASSPTGLFGTRPGRVEARVRTVRRRERVVRVGQHVIAGAERRLLRLLAVERDRPAVDRPGASRRAGERERHVVRSPRIPGVELRAVARPAADERIRERAVSVQRDL